MACQGMANLNQHNWPGFCGCLTEVIFFRNAQPCVCHPWQPKPNLKRCPDGGKDASPTTSLFCAIGHIADTSGRGGVAIVRL